jgi:hypothetical protein
MTTNSRAIRDAITERLTGQDWLPVRIIRNQPLPQLQTDELPGLMVVIMSENMTPDGDANCGPPSYEVDTTIGISLVAGFDEATALDSDIDEIVDKIEDALLRDSSFLHFYGSGSPPLFESITRITRRRLFPQDGESYFMELRLEMTFMHRVTYEPNVPDDYKKTVLTAKLAGSSEGTPTLTVVVDQAT